MILDGRATLQDVPDNYRDQVKSLLILPTWRRAVDISRRPTREARAAAIEAAPADIRDGLRYELTRIFKMRADGIIF